MTGPNFSNDVDLIDVVVPGQTQVITVAVPGMQGPPGALAVGTVTTGAAGSNAAAAVRTLPNGVQVVDFTIPRGNLGPSNSLTIGTVAAGVSAAATITGTAPSQTLNLTLPKGDKGDTGNTGATGPINTITVGTVNTGAPGSGVSVSSTGSAPNQTLNFSIPQGATGATGQTGATGPANVLTIGTVTTSTAGGAAAATITGTTPAQVLNLTIPRGTQGPQGIAGNVGPAGATGATGAAGSPGEPNVLTIGTVSTGASGSPAAASITGASPNQILNLTIPQGPQGFQGIQGDQGPKGDKGDTGSTGPTGAAGQGIAIAGSVSTYANLPTNLTSVNAGDGYLVNSDGKLYIWSGTSFPPNGQGTSFQGPAGPANVLTVGSTTTGNPGTSASAVITGTAPNQQVAFTIPRGATGDTGPANTLTIGTVSTGPAGSAAGATLTGTAPNQTLNLTVPQGQPGATGSQGLQGNQGDPGPAGPVNVLSVGTVTTGSAGSEATASITGISPNQVLNLTIPQGAAGSGASDATTISKGSVQLAGDLGGTAAAPTVPALANKVNTNDSRLTDARTPLAHTHTASQISDSTTTGRSVLTAIDAAAARTTIGAGTSSLIIGTTSTTAKAGDYSPPADAAAGVASMRTLGTGAAQAAAGNDSRLSDARTPTTHTHTASQISDSTVIGRTVMTSIDAAAVRTAIGAGTSSLVIGTTSTTAKAGDYQPTAANISDSTVVGRSVLTALDAAAARTAIGAGTSSLIIGTTTGTAAAGDDSRLSNARTPVAHTHPISDLTATGTRDATTYLRGDGTWAVVSASSVTASQITDATVIGRTVLTSVDAAAVRTAIGAGTGNSNLVIGTTSTTAKAGDYAPPSDGAAGVATMRTLGTAATQAAAGNDSRLSDARTPTAHTQAASTISDSTTVGRAVLTAIDATAARTAIGAGTGTSNLVIGTTAGTAAAGNDSRLSDARTPTAHTHVATTDLTATGTKDATTFLRGDNTWAAPTVAAPSNMQTTDTNQTVTGIKTFGVGKLMMTDGITSAEPYSDINAPMSLEMTQSGASAVVNPATGRITLYTTDGNQLSMRNPAGSVVTTSMVGHTHTAANISDSTATGRSVLTAADATAARTAIGAGTSSLAIGTTSTTAKAGDYAPAAATTGATGLIQLAGALGGTATAPTVPGLALKADLQPAGQVWEGYWQTSTSVIMANNVTANFPFNSVISASTMVTKAANNTDFTILTAGVYDLAATIRWLNAVGTGEKYVAITVNNVIVQNQGGIFAAGPCTLSCAVMKRLAVNDVVRVSVYHAGGANVGSEVGAIGPKLYINRIV